MSAALLVYVLGWGTGAVRALVFMKGWEWFVADTFDAPELAFVQAWGLSLLLSFATVHLSNNDTERLTTVKAVAVVLSSLILSGVFFLSLLILVGFR